MKKILLSAILLVTTSFYAQVGIGTVTPEGALDVVSTNSGVVVPRVANTSAVTTPINGMIIYDVSSNCFKGYQNGYWSDCGFTASAAESAAVLAQIGNEGDTPNTVPSVVTVAQLGTISPALAGLVPANQAAYQAYIDANPGLFASPATQAEVQAMVNAVNAAAVIEAILVQVGNEADAPNTVPSVVTAAQLASVPGVTGVVPSNETAYQAYIDANPALFSAPATVAEVNAMIDAVNASQSVLVQVGNEADAPNTVPSVVTVAQINTISPAVTGAIVANEAAYQAYIDANPNLFASPATQAEVQAMITAVNLATPTTITSTTGKIWMDRNLGATQVATSVTDHLAYGDLYQWGRKADGHEKITWTSGTTGTPVNGTTTVNANTPANNLFILQSSSPYDWRVTQDNNLWNGLGAVNNPCPAGFRVPTSAELTAEVTAYSITNFATAFASPLKFTVPGGRNYSTGALFFVGSNGYYWSSSLSGTNAANRSFYSGSTSVVNFYRAYGFAVRCLKDKT